MAERVKHEDARMLRNLDKVPVLRGPFGLQFAMQNQPRIMIIIECETERADRTSGILACERTVERQFHTDDECGRRQVQTGAHGRPIFQRLSRDDPSMIHNIDFPRVIRQGIQ